jgi:hypothetical protein
MTARLSKDGALLTVHVPMAFRKRGGRKLMLAPSVTETLPQPRIRIDNAMIKAIARAFRWRAMLESGTHATIVEIAAAEKINESYVGRILRLTLLAPDIVEAMLDGRQPAQMTLAVLMGPLPVLWSAQRSELLHPA